MPSPPPAANRFPSRDHLQPTRQSRNTETQSIASEKVPTSWWSVTVMACATTSESTGENSAEDCFAESSPCSDVSVDTPTGQGEEAEERASPSIICATGTLSSRLWRSAWRELLIITGVEDSVLLRLLHTLLDLSEQRQERSVVVLRLLALLLDQLDFALARLDLRLAALTLRLEDADAEQRGGREVLEDGSHEVDERLTNGVFPRGREELGEIAVSFGVREVEQRTPSAPVVVSRAFLRENEDVRTVLREETRDLRLNSTQKHHFLLVLLPDRRNYIQLPQGIPKTVDRLHVAGIKETEEPGVEETPRVVQTLEVAPSTERHASNATSR